MRRSKERTASAFRENRRLKQTKNNTNEASMFMKTNDADLKRTQNELKTNRN